MKKRIENYPLSAEMDIPYEARKELERRIKGLQNKKLDEEIAALRKLLDAEGK